MSYRQSPAWAAAVRAAAYQRMNLRFRVGALENTSREPLVIRCRRRGVRP